MTATPASLLERLRQPGAQQAWTRFVELYTPLLYHWARRLGLQQADAADRQAAPDADAAARGRNHRSEYHPQHALREGHPGQPLLRRRQGAGRVTTKPTDERQDFSLKLTVELADFDDPKKTVTGIENLQIKVRRGEDWHRRVKPLLNIGGLVKYPLGEGGLVLNQLRVPASEGVPVNAEKKRAIVTALLRNLGAVFSGGKVLTLGDLTFRPVPLGEQCNQFLSKDRGWLQGDRDLAHLPPGRNTFAGVSYDVVDFKTSPVPSCVMLAGPGAKGKLAKSVTVKVGGKADSLFFLHTLNKVRDWQPQPNNPQPPPAVFRYVVRYADGKTADVPVRLGEGVEHWLSKSPAGLKDAAVAWAAPFPNDKGGEQAVVYQMQWNNGRPDVEITAVELTYDPAVGDQYGTPALLALTAASRRGQAEQGR